MLNTHEIEYLYMQLKHILNHRLPINWQLSTNSKFMVSSKNESYLPTVNNNLKRKSQSLARRLSKQLQARDLLWGPLSISEE